MAQRDCDIASNLCFRWLSYRKIPHEFDLRRGNWAKLDDEPLNDMRPSILVVDGLDSMTFVQACASMSVEARRLVLVVGVESAAQRASLLQLGFGDVAGNDIDIAELVARAQRIARLNTWLPSERILGKITLDLLARDAYCNGTPLNLNPREFALIWRLADAPNEAVSKQDLIRDVWRMGFVPETNSIAVHMSRLRRKLSFFGLEGIIKTSNTGGYLLVAPRDPMPDTFERFAPFIASPAEVATPAALKHWKH